MLFSLSGETVRSRMLFAVILHGTGNYSATLHPDAADPRLEVD